MSDARPPVEGRDCSGCSLCCFILAVHEIDKPPGIWCTHCPTKRTCEIYERRPQECRDFNCGWLTSTAIGEEWNPRRSRIVLAAQLDGQRLVASVHPDRPNAWRREPYYSQLKAWARAAIAHKGQVVVKVGERHHVILPEEDVEIGLVSEDEVIVSSYTPSPDGMSVKVMKLPRSDPRAAGMS